MAGRPRSGAVASAVLSRTDGSLAPLIIRWGPDASSDMLRRCARCNVCGHKGATLQGPGWKNGEVEWEPFPVDDILPL